MQLILPASACFKPTLSHLYEPFYDCTPMYVHAFQVAFAPGFWTKISKAVIDYQIHSTCPDYPVLLDSTASLIQDKIQSRGLSGYENRTSALLFAALVKKYKFFTAENRVTVSTIPGT